MQELIHDVFVRAFQNPMLAPLHDGATWPVEKGMLAFTAGGKPAHAKVGKKTKVTIDGKKANGGDLKVGMNCSIEYYGDKSQAKAVACK